MLFRILGAPELYDEQRRRRIHLASPMQGALLGALLGQPGVTVPAEQLIGELWGDRPPAKEANALQAHVSRLRGRLALVEPERANAPRLIRHGTGYELTAGEHDTDAGRFRLSVARARELAEHDPQAAYDAFRQALALWRGNVLEGSVMGPICAGVAAEHERTRQDALEKLFETALRTGRHEQVLGELRAAVSAHPGRTRFREQLALALRRRRPAAAAPGARRPGPEADRPGELERLRGLVQLLASEQRSLRNQIEGLTALVSAPE
ncbi:BTAD domain-containing putative transcriptional regulator [Streptomyces sp. ISL-94]|uniref:AfsR/SARP family transcriptional regulator n=1 Tax=Streptomyces sp. ISL-94 TaxID=2819190 RepID=UPI001BE831D3|nr:BTAD domain-containing putative transcriptional regulator [Streptomyces sp. ISL-94]MBT2481604.1 winged helix-turn-helix domain-containing protein [Streptomyces sp. ISL-94]